MLPLPALLAELVRIPSVNPMGRTDIPPELCGESRMTAAWERHLLTLGIPVERQQVEPGRHNLIARYTPPTSPAFTLLFEAHLDTVPTDGMTIEPFAAKVEGGKLYGRGACDVKAGGVAMFGAFRRLVAERPPGSAAVVLAFTVDEEHTFHGVQRLMESGVRADFAVVAEPTRLNIVRQHKGVVRWKLHTSGVACHSSAPERGVSAVYRMAKVLAAVEEYGRELQATKVHPQLGPATLSVGIIAGGVSPNTVPDSCSIHLDRRLLPGESGTEAINDVTRFVRNWPGVDFPLTVTPSLDCPALPAEGGDEWVRRFGDAIDSVVGGHEIHAVPYGTDASTIRQAGIPAVVFGPGDIAQAHTKDEWVELAQVEQAAEVLFRFACGRSGPSGG
ncbi:MAG: M20 family metallopeptidase [Fimbriiglobus sp.]|jgi:acetylornithine deacetylase|nr:M20 family metallopeptidase [Fimbriiglobus sp.]